MPLIKNYTNTEYEDQNKQVTYWDSNYQIMRTGSRSSYNY